MYRSIGTASLVPVRTRSVVIHCWNWCGGKTTNSQSCSSRNVPVWYCTDTNPIGRCPVVIAQMPSFDSETRGQFDDVLWVQLARAKMATLNEAAQKAVEAPIALPNDVSHLAIGGDAIIVPPHLKVRRVELQVPSTISLKIRHWNGNYAQVPATRRHERWHRRQHHHWSWRASSHGWL